MQGKRRIRRRMWLVNGLAMLIVAIASAGADAAPTWRLDVVSNTTVLPGDTVTIHLEGRNIGTSNSSGPIIVTGSLPAGLTIVSLTPSVGGILPQPPCTAADGSTPVGGQGTMRCATTSVVPILSQGGSNGRLVYEIVVQAGVGVVKPTTLTSSFEISGGGALSPASTADVLRVDDPPGFGVSNFDAAVTGNTAEDVFTQAGGHPYAATTSIDFNTVHNPLPMIGDLWPVEPLRDVVADLPAGFVGGTAGLDRCTAAELANASGLAIKPLCPVTSQIGSTLVRFNGTLSAPNVFGPVPVYNMVPPPGVPAQFGFNLIGTVVTLNARVRSDGDYGLSIDVKQIPEGLAVAGTSLTFWGVPSDPSHDRDRACPGKPAPWSGGPTCTSGARPSALLRNPTSCTPPAGSPVQDGLVTSIAVGSWDHPGARDGNGAPDPSDPNWKHASVVSHELPGYPHAPQDFGPHLLPTGCDKVPFDPKLTLQPSAPARSGSPTGFQVDLDMPQSNDPTTTGEADLKQAVVTLPAGMHVSASSADGLGACSPAQIGLHSTAAPTCPDSSKVGTLEITTPLLDEHLKGSIYLATPHDNPFHSLIAIYLVAQGAGVTVKIPGEVVTDPNTGQITTKFDNNPQVPFSNLHLDFFGGARAALVAPAQCGTYTTHAELYSWAQPNVKVVSDSSFDVSLSSDGSACAPRGFSPGFSAGSVSPDAGKSSPFVFRLTRDDSDQELSSVSLDEPTGLLAKIANVTLCPAAAAVAGTCRDVSKIGSVTVGAGAGPDPFYIQSGRAYLTGPYKGAPFGLSIVVPAVAGPFDLGNVIVRSKVEVDRTTAQVRVVSDPLPTILQGIPLDVRDVRILADRRDFFVNPTNCVAKRVLATVRSTQGAVAHLSSRYRVANCATLRLAPKLSMTVGARRHTRAGVSTPVTATLTMPKGGTNLRSVSVVLPGTLNARLPVINRACKLSEFQAGRCTSKAKAGTAVAVTPLLRDPLRGSVFFVKNPARVLPDLMVALRGQVALDVPAKTSIPGGKRLGTRFDAIPDAPITKFTLRIVSGQNGPVGIVTNLCSAKGRAATASVAFRGQNNALVQTKQRVHIRGCPKASRGRRAR
jgi:uncharacterized repeat protein (TIGR01451 family)